MTSSELGVFFIPDCVETELCPLSPTVVAIFMLNLLVLLQDNLRQRIVQDVITIVVKSDRNNDQSIDRVEAKILALQIRLALQEYGVEFISEKFVLAIRQNPSVSGVWLLREGS